MPNACAHVSTGFLDPLLATALGPTNPAARVSLAFAFNSKDAPLKQYNVTDVRYLTHVNSPLISEVSIATGKRANQTAGQVCGVRATLGLFYTLTNNHNHSDPSENSQLFVLDKFFWGLAVDTMYPASMVGAG